MPDCPAGHGSAARDYCDVCGTRMGAAAPADARTPVGPCVACGAARSGRFCEECGHDGMLPAPAPASGSASGTPAPGRAPDLWMATVRADEAWFAEVRAREGPDAGSLSFPRYCPERRFALTGRQLAIGRRNPARGVDPEIDLSGPPLDPGVSTLHALLLPRPDSGWEIVDLGSTNGTVIGNATASIPPNTPVPLADGDRIKIGAWTTITVTAQSR